MTYREHAPAAALVPWIECAWERSGDGAPVRVLPDGCIDIVWTEGRGHARGRFLQDARAISRHDVRHGT